MRTSVNLAGGGARGITQAGYVKALAESTIKPDVVFGSSVGALNGCLYIQEDIQGMEQLWYSISNNKVFKFHFWTVPQLLVNRNHLYDSAPLRSLIDSAVDFPKLKAKGQNFKVTATNLTDWKTESYSPGELSEEEFKTFLLASASPPMAFPPVEFRGKFYGDGGIINNFNLSNAVRAGADFILIITPTVQEAIKVNNALDMFNILVSLPEYCYLDRELAFIDKINQIQAAFPDLREIKHYVLKPPEPTGISLLDFDYKGRDRHWDLHTAYLQGKKEIDSLLNQAQ